MTQFSGNPPPSALQIRLGSVPIEIDGRRFEFKFPDSGNMRTLIARVLSGQEYPILRLPGYSPAVIVDVGANVGASALYFHRAFPQAKILCFEPSPTNVSFLRQNIAPVPQIQAFGYGLLDRDERVKLFIGKTQYMQNSLLRNIETSDAFEHTEVRSAHAEFARQGLKSISILKLDTEGCEVPILTDIKSMLDHTDFVYVEYHSEEDRLAIDGLLGAHFMLATSHAIMPHRGTSIYVAKRLTKQFPMLDAARIKRG